jgi:DNA invertase Pin-like site-specific DNA recombinase
MTRVALYARYSSDNQRAASIEDQFRLCEAPRARAGKWLLSRRRHLRASMILRPGIQTLLRDAQAGQFDIVLAEALDASPAIRPTSPPCSSACNSPA